MEAADEAEEADEDFLLTEVTVTVIAVIISILPCWIIVKFEILYTPCRAEPSRAARTYTMQMQMQRVDGGLCRCLLGVL